MLGLKRPKDRRGIPQLTRAQALRATPVKNRDVEEQRLSGGELLLSAPVRLRPWMAALGRWLGAGAERPQRAKIQLDRLGSSVWDLLDGRRSLDRVIESFAAAHGLEAREAEMAVTRFVRELGRRGLVGLR